MADTSLNENRLSLLIWQISNIWQSKIRKILRNFDISVNEYLILESLYKLNDKPIYDQITQQNISFHSYIDTSVISSKTNLLEKKNYIYRSDSHNKRSNSIRISLKGKQLMDKLILDIENEEKKLFEKLGVENNNFLNSLKLILGKKIRVKAN
tara:strand:- start:9 stop:467 length:459 start_codon:yes stop_codon:yes gene_type:complete